MAATGGQSTRTNANPFPELDDELGRLIFGLVIERALPVQGMSNAALDGADRVWLAAEAAENLAAAIERENGLSAKGRAGLTRVPLVVERRTRLAREEKECRRWLRHFLNSRPDAAEWPHWAAVEVHRAVEMGVKFDRPDLLRSLEYKEETATATAPFGDPDPLRKYAGDLRRLSNEIAGRTQGRRGRGARGVAGMGNLVIYARCKGIANPEVSRRIVAGFGLSADGSERPHREKQTPRRGTTEAKDIARWESAQTKKWTKKLEDTERWLKKKEPEGGILRLAQGHHRRNATQI